ncbi:hypothetical protein FB451DRAFT_680395 [Mycena latifolia]|nr:hypothetical protein FB451DRAFT_680395 [Mycena latifolia]
MPSAGLLPASCQHLLLTVHARMEQFNGHNLTIRDRIRHNILPSDVERQAIVESVTAAKERLSEIRAMDSGSPEYAGHNVEENTLCQYISDHASMCAPIRLLSQDILETIFLNPKIHGSVYISRSQSRAVAGSPHVLASVSHYWRCVALGTPRLWSSIYINGCRRYSLRHLRLCLERSKDAALSIIIVDLRDGRPFDSLGMDILHEIMTHAERWVNLEILTKIPDCLDLFAPVRGRLPWLEKISLKFSSDIMWGDVFNEAPRLHTVCLCRLSSAPPIPVLPLHQIRTVKYTDVKSKICGDILTIFFPAAVAIIIDSCHAEFDPPSSPKLHLATKKITILGEDAKRTNMMDILHRLTTPNLEQLCLVDCAFWDAASLFPFISRSACHLQSLVLRNTRVRAGELLAFVRVIPTLKVLSLTELLPNSITDLIMTALTPLTGSESVALPALTHIALAGVYLFSTGALLRMLKARKTSLVVIDLTLPGREVNPADRAQFAALQPSTEYQSLRCLDEARRQVWIGHRGRAGISGVA